MITSVQSLTRIGETLPNGAVLVARAWTRTEDWLDGNVYHEAIVLAVREVHRPSAGSRVEYVTWLYCLDPLRGEVTINGRYFDGFIDAALDYEKRVKNLLIHDGPYKPRILT